MCGASPHTPTSKNIVFRGSLYLVVVSPMQAHDPRSHPHPCHASEIFIISGNDRVSPLTSASLIMPEALDFLSSKATLQLSVSTVAFMSGLFVMIPLLFHYITNLTLFQAFSIFFSTHSSKLPYKWITILKNRRNVSKRMNAMRLIISDAASHNTVLNFVP